MNGLTGIALAAAMLALAVALVYALVRISRQAMLDDAPPPFIRMLERQGLALDGVVAEVGIGPMARAARRCTFCDNKAACRAALDLPSGCGFPPFCPNAALFSRAGGRR